MYNVFFHDLNKFDGSLAPVADAFFNYLYEQISDGVLPQSIANQQIPTHVVTYKDNDDCFRAIVVEHAGIEANPLDGFRPPIEDVADQFCEEMIQAKKAGYQKDTWGYVDCTSTMAQHFSKRGEMDKVRVIERWTNYIDPEQMHDALARRDFAPVVHVIKNDGDVNARNTHGARPAISYAKSIEHFEGMIKFGADPTIIDGFGDDITYFYNEDHNAEPELKQFAYGFIETVYALYGRKPNIPCGLNLSQMDKLTGKVEVDPLDKNFRKGHVKAKEYYDMGLLRDVSLGEQKQIDPLFGLVKKLQVSSTREDVQTTNTQEDNSTDVTGVVPTQQTTQTVSRRISREKLSGVNSILTDFRRHAEYPKASIKTVFYEAVSTGVEGVDKGPKFSFKL